MNFWYCTNNYSDTEIIHTQIGIFYNFFELVFLLIENLIFSKCYYKSSKNFQLRFKEPTLIKLNLCRWDFKTDFYKNLRNWIWNEHWVANRQNFLCDLIHFTNSSFHSCFITQIWISIHVCLCSLHMYLIIICKCRNKQKFFQCRLNRVNLITEKPRKKLCR